jgi:hypothetical protein
MDHVLKSFFRETSSPPWKIGAHWHKEFEGNEHVEFGLYENKRLGSIGTVHRVHNLSALKANLSTIVAELEQLATKPDLLKCPECGIRWVSLKEPRPGSKRFNPFLSCQGMQVERQGRDRDVACRGVSKRIPPLKPYR